MKMFFILSGILLILSVAIHFFLPLLIVQTKYIFTINANNENLQGTFSANQESKACTIISNDGLQLSGYFTKSNADTVRGTVILVHGIYSKKELYTSVSKQLSDRGYNSLAIDLRGHGNSEGKYTTFGVKEKHDVAAWVTFLEEESSALPIGIWGQSLGGAVALQSLAFDSRLQFGIIESTFSDLYSITLDYSANILPFRSKSFMKYQTNRGGKLANFSPSIASPYNACLQITQPIFYAHSIDDEKVSITYGRKNYNALQSTQKQFVEIEKAPHSELWEYGGESYFESIYLFLDQISSL